MICRKFVVQCGKCKEYFRKNGDVGNDIVLFDTRKNAEEVIKFFDWKYLSPFLYGSMNVTCPECLKKSE